MKQRDPVKRVKVIAIIAVAAVGLISYIVLDNRIGATESDIASDACQKGRERSLFCRAQTCRRLEAVGGHARLCNDIAHKVGRQPDGRLNLPDEVSASPPSSGGGGGGGASPAPGATGPSGPAGSPGAPGGSGGSTSPVRSQPPVDVQLPDLPSVCVGGVGGVNC